MCMYVRMYFYVYTVYMHTRIDSAGVFFFLLCELFRLLSGSISHLPPHGNFDPTEKKKIELETANTWNKRSSKEDDGEKRGKKPRWVRTNVNVQDHVIVPEIDLEGIQDTEQFTDHYVTNLTTVPLNTSKPLWEIHILNVKTSDAESIAVIRSHHSLGDGLSLMSLVLACTRKTSDPEALPTVPVMKRHQLFRSDRNLFIRSVLAVWLVMRLILNTVVDVLLFLATTLFLKDTETPLKGGADVGLNPKRFAHRIVPLDDIKLIKNAMKMTINDVLLGVTQAALSRYLNRRYDNNNKEDEITRGNRNNLPRRIRLRATVLSLADMMGKGSKFRWGNRIGYVILPFSITLRTNPLDHLSKAKATIDRKKLSLEAALTYFSAKLVLNTLGVKVAAKIVHRALSNTTMSFSNIVGPVEEISFYGHPISYFAPSVYGHPQALTVHFQSYANKMTISTAVDPKAISDPRKLCDDFEESLKAIKVAVLERGLLKDTS
ncbi:PREDICTED: O-acyltransferase WSD1-like isoform X2 [Tarenaya hassleriana]|uniref:O-acyltransferase WSD1-like isoform X2 n=1 Tax=Tarenaya hassleriana TaxID=28532 RepID=UPI00053C45C6|nr:PREDICTED: O-acyltransferase WSD1-like isoform X2 [Tarenaya hassleriana]